MADVGPLLDALTARLRPLEIEAKLPKVLDAIKRFADKVKLLEA